VSSPISEQLVRQSVVPMACTIADGRSVPEAGVIPTCPLETKCEHVALMLMRARFPAPSGGRGGLKTFEEGEQGVGRAVAAGVPAGRRDAVEGALLEREVGLQADVRGALCS
jgi:hypothetical protein